MFIQTEPTPNPNSMKFIPDGLEVAGNHITEYKNKEQALGKSKLAEKLFQVSGVDSIFFGSDFITVNKFDGKNWLEMKTEILTTIMDFFIPFKILIYSLIAYILNRILLLKLRIQFELTKIS